MLVTREFEFAAAHFLTEYKGKCENLHGHTYKMQVSVSADPGEDGLAYDFSRIKEVVNSEVIDIVDHASLNEIIGPHPSAENIALWSWKKLKDKLPLYEIKVWESPTSSVTYRGDLE